MIDFIIVIDFIIGADTNTFIEAYDCTCLGYTHIFECTVCGPGSTVWQGSALQCPSSKIILRHSQFNSQAHGQCNDGAIVTSSVGTQDGCFTSILSVMIGQEMINRTIECAYDNIQTGKLIINQTTLRLTQGI